MKFLDLKTLKEMFLNSAVKIEREKEQINKINVFPVPDQDTGTNLFKTLEGIKNTIKERNFQTIQEFSQIVLEAALMSAQGNAGVIFTGFLAGFLPNLQKEEIDAKTFAFAFEKGKEKAFKSIMNPKEGTILDVIEAASQTFQEEAKKEEDLLKIFPKVLENAKKALLATQEKMEILKKANVVDAGGMGFLMILESYYETISPSGVTEKKEKEMVVEEVKRIIQIISHRYEIVTLLSHLKESQEKIKESLKNLGNCLDIVDIGEKVKIHIHTDFPEKVKEVLREIGKIEDLKVEDMTREISKEPSQETVSIGIVTENIASLVPKIIERYQIQIVEAKFFWPDLDKIEGNNLYEKIKKAYEMKIETRPTTSQPSPGEYYEAFKTQLDKFENVLCLTVSSELSGSFNSALQAREMFGERDKKRIFIFDTKNGAAGQALFVLRAIELIKEQRKIEEILEELENLITKTKLYIIFADPKGLEFIGRINKNQANWIRKMKNLGFHPIIELRKGRLEKGGIVLAKSEEEALFKKLEKESKKQRKEGKNIRVVINYADALEKAKKLKEKSKEINCEVSFISEAPFIIWAVTGPGTLILGWQPI